MEFEQRYFVLKLADAKKYLTHAEILDLTRLILLANSGRIREGKADLSCLVIESDWPEYAEVSKLLAARISGIKH